MIKMGKWAIIIGTAFWLIETFAFGFNNTPCCLAEKVCDRIAALAVFVGLFWAFWGILDIAQKAETIIEEFAQLTHDKPQPKSPNGPSGEPAGDK